MKKLLLFSWLLAQGAGAMAQFNFEGSLSPVKLSDIEANYRKNQQPYAHAEKVNRKGDKHLGVKESTESDYQFDRWKWYCQQRLDNNGYIVSPVKTFNNWRKYEQNQKTERTTGASSGANWVFQGDDSSGANGSGVGRINMVAFHPTDMNTYWVATPGGGAWKTTNNGATWKCMTDKLPMLSASVVRFNPKNPNTVYLCTGDKDGNDFYSVGLLKSYDGGATWDTTGLVWNDYQNQLANDLLVNPLDSNSLIFGASSGIFRSFDGGATWTQVAGTATHPGDFKELLYHPADTNIVYATSHVNYDASGYAQIYRSANGGMTWKAVTTFTDAYRIAIAVTPANPAIVEAVVASSASADQNGLEGIWKSTDTGKTFTEIFSPGNCDSSNDSNLLSEGYYGYGTGCGGQGFYDLAIAIDPLHPNNVYLGGVYPWVSADGGKTWNPMDQWDSVLSPGYDGGIHVDKHFLGFDPLVSGRLFETNDGGVYWSDNPTASTSKWNDVTNGIGNTEFYRVAVSNLATYEAAGAQDVGTKLIQNFSYQDLFGGDGMECQLDYADSNTAYASSEYGYIGRLDAIGSTIISNNVPGSPTGGWITPYIIEPTCHTCLLVGYQDVYRSTDKGDSWTDISGTLTSYDLIRVETTLADSNYIYATDGSNNIFYTNDMGKSAWSTITAPYGSQYISDLVVDPATASHLWVVFGGYAEYGSPQVVEYSPGTGWASYNANLPDVPVTCIHIDAEDRTLYVGTDVGVYYRDTTMTDWQPFNTGLPAVAVYDLQIDYATNQIWAATFGRSLWTSPRHLLKGEGIAATPSILNSMNVSPNPNHGSFTVTLGSVVNDNEATLNLTDNTGKTVWQGNSAISAGTKLHVNTSGLVRGIYFIEVSTQSGIIGRQKVVIY